MRNVARNASIFKVLGTLKLICNQNYTLFKIGNLTEYDKSQVLSMCQNSNYYSMIFKVETIEHLICGSRDYYAFPN